MEVTNKNFDELLQQIEESIDRASFVAIDCELSGLKSTDEKDNCFESMEERYHSVRNSATNFLVVQFGLCPFFFNPDKNEFTHEAYNFYTYPRQINKNGPNVRFLCESSSLDFLASCGFDFNKLFYEGIPYLTISDENTMKEDIEQRALQKEADDDLSPLLVPENLKSFLKKTKFQIESFLASPSKETKLENLTPFQRKLVFHNLRPGYASKLFFETISVNEPNSMSGGDSQNNSYDSLSDETEMSSDVSIVENTIPGKTKANRTTTKARVLRITKLDQRAQAKRIKETRDRDLENVSKNVGFARVIRKLSKSEKIIVGHNMLLDISHTVHQFVSELPDNLSDFKLLVQNTFPNLIDTKYMAVVHPFRELISSSVLFDLIKRVQESPFQLPKIGVSTGPNTVGYEVTDRKKHEAGFDAFTTGCCFIALSHYLGTRQNPPKATTLPCSPLLLPVLNKLYIMRMSDISYLNISGTDLTPSRSHVFYVTCPKEATQKNIQQIFSPFGNIQVWWRNTGSLFVALSDKDQSSLVMDNIQCKSGYRVLTFAAYQKMIRDEKKRPLKGDSPERAGDIFKKMVCGDKSPTGEHKKKRPKTEAEKVKIKQVFAQPSTWN